MPVALSLAAGRWLLDSGIQQPSGGFARFYDAKIQKNRAVSTEISGYAASALIYLFNTTGDEEFLDSAKKVAWFLLNAWDPHLDAFPYEHPSPSPGVDHLSYFFDSGIVIRGLLAVWRETGDERLIEIAQAAARGMIADFRAQRDYHPILQLPDKNPLPRTDQWSRTSGCYQLKAAMAWWDVAEATGDGALRDAYLEMLESALATHSTFLPGAASEHRVMDRLHAYCYFLEGLLPMLDRGECARAYSEGMNATAWFLRQIAPTFARSDVYAQLLRARVYGDGVVPVDTAAASEEAERLAAFQAVSHDPRVDGGFYFGRHDGRISPHVNPVSTSFGVQALEMWRQYRAGNNTPCIRMLI